MIGQHMGSLIREMNRLERAFGRMYGAPAAMEQAFPALNLWGNEETLHLTAEIPGVDAEALQIHVEKDVLTIRGERKTPEDKDRQWYRRERLHGSFERSLTLPYRVDADAVDASLQNGILTLRLPRAEADKPRRITVQGA